MARRAQPIAVGAGTTAAALVAVFVAGPLIAVFLRAEAPAALGPADWAAVRFTVVQAVISAALSVALAIPVARALARRDFPGRRLLVTLLGAPFILPVIVAVLGIIAIFGQNGLISRALMAGGFEPISIYGAQGVILAHVFFNLPLATRFLLQGWQSVPAERFRLAASLGMTAADISRAIERPMLRAVVPGAAMVIFLVCLTSFAVALTLGGGPRATTVELAIYQAFRFDFDLGKAALLALVQLVLTLAATALAWRIAVPSAFGTGLDRPVTRWDARTPALRAIDTAAIVLVALFLLLPLGAVVVAGLPRLADLPAGIWAATLRSVLVALSSATLTLILSGAIAAGAATLAPRAPRRAGMIEGAGYLTVAASSLVVGTGLFIVLFPIADPRALALPVTALVNALMALPFTLRVLIPAVADVLRDYARLADSLAMPPLARLRLVYLPRLSRPIGFGAGLAAALSMGDLGVIILFADPQAPTLPLQVYSLMGAYRMADAAAAALLLVTISVALFWIFDRGGRMNARE
jgi:thiamine transport system permease protein